MWAECVKYPALYDPASKVRFRGGRAEVTEEQALILAERRYMDGITVDGQHVKEWARDRNRLSEPEPAVIKEATAEPSGSASEDTPTEGRRSRKAR